MTMSGSAGDEGALAGRRARFDRWRRDRPFLGGALLILASLVIAWIPINIAPDTILIGETLSPIGLLFAALVFLCGIFALTRPGLADIFGIFGIVFSIFSLYGALGGLGIGLALGLVGGNLCYAWEAEESDERGGSGGNETTTETDGEDSGFVFDDSDDSDGGLFGTRSIHPGAHETGKSSRLTSGGAGGRTASIALILVTTLVLGAFVGPFVAAAAGPFPDQSQIDGTVVVADQFSGQGYNHENVTTDTSNRDGVPAARQSFSSAQIQGMTIYKNFRTGQQTPYSIVISGSSSSAPNGLSLTASEFYASQLSFAGVVPLARNKWSTCPGEDFLLSNGDIIRPPIAGQDVTTNTHQLSAETVTIQNLNLTVQQRPTSTSVTGTPECTTEPVETVLDLFSANALNLLVEEGRLDPNVTSGSGVSDLSAPSEVEQGETFNVSATVTNTGYLEDTMTVQYGFGDGTVAEKNVTLAPNESTTVTFADAESSNTTPGTYDYAVAAGNGSATGTIDVTAPATNQTASNNESNVTSTNTTPTNTTASTDETPSASSANTIVGSENATTEATDTSTDTTSTVDERTQTTETTSTDDDTTTETTEANTTSSTTETSAEPSKTTQTPSSSTAPGASDNETSSTNTTATTTPIATDSVGTNSTSTADGQSSFAGFP